MSIPTRVVLEIDADRYVKRIYAGDKLVSELEMVVYSRGGAKSTKKEYCPYEEIFASCPDFDEEYLEVVAEAFDQLCGFDMATSLYKLREDAK